MTANVKALSAERIHKKRKNTAGKECSPARESNKARKRTFAEYAFPLIHRRNASNPLA